MSFHRNLEGENEFDTHFDVLLVCFGNLSFGIEVQMQCLIGETAEERSGLLQMRMVYRSMILVSSNC